MDRYDGMKGKESAIANMRQARLEREHSAKDQFVKQQQASRVKMDGRAPNLKEEAMRFNAYQCNDGYHAQRFAKELTVGLDKMAYPVDGEGDDS